MNPLGLYLLIVTWARSTTMFKWISGPYRYGFKYIYIGKYILSHGYKGSLGLGPLYNKTYLWIEGQSVVTFVVDRILD